jgi:hypothetical protein
LLQDKIQLIHGLAGEIKGESRIFESDFHVMNSIFSENKSRGNLVPYVDLNFLYDGCEIDLLKCDIEGSEEKFIENHASILARTRFAVFELHPNFCNVDRCFDLLVQSGFGNNIILRDTPNFKVVFFSKAVPL